MLDQESQTEISRAMSGVLEVLRLSSALDDSKAYALAILVLKYATDIASTVALEERAAPHSPRFHVSKDADFYTLCEASHAPGNGDRINRALHRLEQENEQLRGIFFAVDFCSPQLGGFAQSDLVLRRLLETINIPALDFRAGGSPAAAFACDALVIQAEQAAGKRAAEPTTPSDLSRLIAFLMQPKARESVCDPCCGLAQTLVECNRQARNASGGEGCVLFGQEAVGNVWALARMNMILRGETQYQLEWGNTLRTPKLLDGQGKLKKFDLVVSNPPFSQRNWGHDEAQCDPYERYRRGVPPRGSADFAFISHMVETLKPDTGRMAVVVSHGVLFRGGVERHIRKELINENLIDAVIALPPKMFMTTGIPTAILVLRKDKKDKDVLFIDASRSFQPGKAQNRLDEKSLGQIVATYQSRISVKQYSKLVTASELAAHDYNLAIARYIEVAEKEEEINLEELRSERGQLKNNLSALEAKLARLLEEIGHA